jgi:hypothetical protein
MAPIFLWLGALLAAQGAPALPRGDLPTAAEVLAGFRQNQEAFRTLRVIWRQELVPAEGYFHNHAYQAAIIEKSLLHNQVAPDQQQFTENQLKWNKKASKLENADENTIRLYQDFRTDWRGFQMRSPRQFASFHKPPVGFRFPEAPLTEEHLATTFAHFRILIHAPEAAAPYTVWDGVGPDGLGTGRRMAKKPTETWFAFPPLAQRAYNSAASGHWDDVNWIDRFFAGTAEEFEVVAADADGRHVTVRRVLYKNRNKQSFIPIEYQQQFHDRVVERHTVATATLDSFRGWLPVRIKYHSYFVVDGKRLEGPGRDTYAPSEDDGLHVLEIKRIENGGWYPTRMEYRRYFMDLEDYRGGQLPESLAGTAKPSRLMLFTVTTTTVEQIEAGTAVDPTTMPLPKGTMLLDATQGGVAVLGNPQDVLEALAASVNAANVHSPWKWAWLATLFAANLALLCLVIWGWRRKRRQAATP